MNPLRDRAARDPAAPQSDDEATGLPLLHSWKRVYLFVAGWFLIWVGLLVALTVLFS
jgi:hypothetical protein